MGSLISHASMTVDGLCDVGDWFVTEGLELIDVTGYDSGVLRQRYRPAT